MAEQISWRDRLYEIRDKRPEQLTISDIYYLVSRIEILEAERESERWRYKGSNSVALRYADGNYCEIDLKQIAGASWEKPPRDFLMPLRHTRGVLLDAAETSSGALNHSVRKFELYKRTGWSGQLLYEEVFP